MCFGWGGPRHATGCSVSSLLPTLPVCIDSKLAKIHAAEAKVLALMPDTPYETRDVPVRLDAKARCFLRRPAMEYTIRTVIIGEEHADRAPIVLVHGFMMGSAGFFKLLPLLARHRRVYAIDIIGMGGSGRPPFDAERATAAEAEELLVKPFELWAEAMGLSKFVLLGHSYGGFVATCWADRQADAVLCLGLLSPLLGFSDERISRLMEPKEGESWRRYAFRSLVETAWERHITPQTLVRWCPGFKSWFERMSVHRFGRDGWVADMTDEEGRLLSAYLAATLDAPASAEATATVCFGPMLRAMPVGGLTVKQRLARLAAPVFAVYGDHDWMDRPDPAELPACDFVTIERSGHHLYFDNPQALASCILQRIRDF